MSCASNARIVRASPQRGCGSFQERRTVDFVFFFSSRRRHTRFDCDWSSDVCSSDLGPPWSAQTKHVPYAARAPWTLSPAPPSQANWQERATANGNGYGCLQMPRRKNDGGYGERRNPVRPQSRRDRPARISEVHGLGGSRGSLGVEAGRGEGGQPQTDAGG